MEVDKEKLKKVAHLARLNIKPEEEDQLLKDMGEILNWVEKLREVDTEGVEPITHMTQEVNVLRNDEAEISISRKEALKNAPDEDGKYFKVPKVLKRND
ncbi:Asp-tRNA(Asn)/Glu-tRNA(Gln) amidotransferase subunit GatC [Roseivirga sp.]|uniref:Asp-tRNA(Asn)/Glu-tRNA(Gln) amidotransferase subunit GatC n=1 Tax=Roseivirga sp. TaxID=1964215 RepID=UPI003B52FF91